MSSTRLAGTTSIVTGASRGFGRGIATALAVNGSHVVGVARDAAALEELRDEIGPSFTPVVADVADEGLAARLVREFRPGIMVLNAGATPEAATLRDQSWATFSRNWDVDVRHVFDFCREALVAPLRPGSTVISLSSGAAVQGSPLSGGYAGAKATVRFISAYARSESDRDSSAIRFVALLPKITSATALGSRFIDGYAAYDGIGVDEFRSRIGPSLTVEQVAGTVVELVTAEDPPAAALLTADGLTELPA